MSLVISEESKDLIQAHAKLWNLVFSYLKSVALGVALDLRIADAIHHHGGAATLSQIAQEIGIKQTCKISGLRRLMRVLTVAETFTIIQPAADDHEPVYKLTTVSRLLISGGESSTSPSLFPTLSLELSSFRDTEFNTGLTAWFLHDDGQQPAGPCPFTLMYGESYWEMNQRDGAVNASFNSSMAADSNFLMQIVLKDFRQIFHGIDSLVDVAGGHGGAAISIAAAFPCIKCSVLDLPHVIAKAPSNSNVQFVAGDMFESIPPANAVFLKWIFHDWSDDKCIKILKNCKQAIPSRDAGGKIIIIDMVVGSNSLDTKLLETQVICDLDMMKIDGAERDEQEWKKLFLGAGFKDYNIMPVLGLRSIIELYP